MSKFYVRRPTQQWTQLTRSTFICLAEAIEKFPKSFEGWQLCEIIDDPNWTPYVVRLPHLEQ